MDVHDNLIYFYLYFFVLCFYSTLFSILLKSLDQINLLNKSNSLSFFYDSMKPNGYSHDSLNKKNKDKYISVKKEFKRNHKNQNILYSNYLHR